MKAIRDFCCSRLQPHSPSINNDNIPANEGSEAINPQGPHTPKTPETPKLFGAIVQPENKSSRCDGKATAQQKKVRQLEFKLRPNANKKPPFANHQQNQQIANMANSKALEFSLAYDQQELPVVNKSGASDFSQEKNPQKSEGYALSASHQNITLDLHESVAAINQELPAEQQFNSNELAEFVKYAQKHYDKFISNKDSMFISKNHFRFRHSAVIYRENGVIKILIKPNIHNNDLRDPKNKTQNLWAGSYKQVKTSGLTITLGANREISDISKTVTVSKAPYSDAKDIHLNEVLKLDLAKDGFKEIKFDNANKDKRSVFIKKYLGEPLSSLKNKLSNNDKRIIVKEICKQTHLGVITIEGASMPLNGDKSSKGTPILQISKEKLTYTNDSSQQYVIVDNNMAPIYDMKLQNSLWYKEKLSLIDINCPTFTYNVPNDKVTTSGLKLKYSDDPALRFRNQVFSLCYALYDLHETKYVDSGAAWNVKKPTKLMLNSINPYAEIVQKAYAATTPAEAAEIFMKLKERVNNY